MPGFLYFIPDHRDGSPITEDVLASFGLSHIRDHRDHQVHSRGVVANGPGGLRGVVIGLADTWAVEEVKQSAELQWVKFPKPHAECQAWLGWKKDALPKPADLARGHQLPGEWLTLADSEKWLVPIARDIEGVCKLPLAYGLDDDTGKWVANRVRREYATIWQHATDYYASLMTARMEAVAAGEDSFSFDIPDGEGMVADALSVNYRVSQRELATLGVLVSGIIQEIADVLIDARDAKKK